MTNQIIFILSPEKWGTMKLSKHHYALELANMGNNVYFFEPALRSSRNNSCRLLKTNLWITNYPLIARGRKRLPSFIYKIFLKNETRKMQAVAGISPTITWCFDGERLNRLEFFRNSLKIFHPVDFFNSSFIDKMPVFDVSFSTMQKQVNDLRDAGYPSFFINHGLSGEFVEYALKRLGHLQSPADNSKMRSVKVGYVGNLLSEPPDRSTMKEVIRSNPNIEFHFWGQHERKNSNLATYQSLEVEAFIDFLKEQPQVILHGPVDTAILAPALQQMDMHWICWDISQAGSMWNRDTNPHKIMEYLSTGRPVISHFMQNYAVSNLVFMSKFIDNRDYVALFRKTVEQVLEGENVDLIKSRIQYALSNTYKKQIEKISDLISRI